MTNKEEGNAALIEVSGIEGSTLLPFHFPKKILRAYSRSTSTRIYMMY